VVSDFQIQNIAMSDSVDAKPEDVTLVEPEELNEMIFGDADQTGEVSVISQPTKSEKPRKRAPRKSKSEGGEASATPKPKRAKKVAVAVEATASSQAETQEEASSAQAGEGNTDTAETPEAVAELEEAAARVGERVWGMPLPSELRSLLSSDVADIANAKPGEVLGGMLLAGVFLKEFVGEGIP